MDEGFRSPLNADANAGAPGFTALHAAIMRRDEPMVRALVADDDQLRIVKAVAEVESIDGAALMEIVRTAMYAAQAH